MWIQINQIVVTWTYKIQPFIWHSSNDSYTRLHVNKLQNPFITFLVNRVLWDSRWYDQQQIKLLHLLLILILWCSWWKIIFWWFWWKTGMVRLTIIWKVWLIRWRLIVQFQVLKIQLKWTTAAVMVLFISTFLPIIYLTITNVTAYFPLLASTHLKSYFLKHFIQKYQSLVEINHFQWLWTFHWEWILKRHQTIANLRDVEPVSRF